MMDLPKHYRPGAFVGGVVLLTAIALRGGNGGLVAGSLLVVAVCIPTILRLRRDYLDGPGIYAALSAVMFGVLSLVWLGHPMTTPPTIDVYQVADAVLLVAAGLACFGIAARLVGPARPRPPLRLVPAEMPSVRVLAAVFVIGATGTAIGLSLGALGYSATVKPAGSGVLAGSQALQQLASVGTLAVLVTALVYFGSGSSGHRKLLLVLTPLQVAVGFASGFKGVSLAPVVLVGLAYTACRMRLPGRTLVVALVAAVLLVPAVGVYRTVIRNDTGPRVPPLSSVLNQAEYYASARFRLIDHVAVIKARTPSTYKWGDGSRYLTLPAIVAVPRALWPEKPILDDGLQFAHTYWEVSSGTRTFTPPTQVGDLYRNFAIPGVAIGLAIWGGVIAAFTRVCRRWRSPRVEMLYLVSLLYWIPSLESDLPDLIAGASKTMPVAAALAWFLLPGRRVPPGYRRIAARVGIPGRIRLRPSNAQRASGSASAQL